MKTQELILKAKQDFNSLSFFELRRLANVAWKEDCLTLNGLVKYINRTEDKNLSAILSKAGIDKSVITVKWLLTNANPDKLTNKAGEKRQFFGLWFVTETIQRFHATIQAAAQSSKPKVIKEKTDNTKVDLTESSGTEKEVKKEVELAAAKVAANKRSNEAKKPAAKKPRTNKQKTELKNVS